MEDREKHIPKGTGMGIGIAIGMACGVITGVIMDEMAIGIAIGAGVGVSIGVALENKSRESAPGEKRRQRKWIILIVLTIIAIGLLSFLYLLFRV